MALVDDLGNLPKPHLTWLYKHYGIGRRRNKIAVLAKAMADAGIARYRYSYLGSTTGPVTYYCYDGRWDAEVIIQRFRQANPSFLTEIGAQPDLIPNGPPQINRVYQPDDQVVDEIIVELGAMDVSRVITKNWKQETIVSDRGIRASISGDDEELTLEVRGTANPDAVAAIVVPTSGIGAFTSNAFHLTGDMEQRLKASLKARSRRSYAEHADQVFSRTRIEGRPGVDLQTEEQHKTFLATYGGEEYAHGYEAVIKWPTGYDETLNYKVDRPTGLISIGSRNASEYALAEFRRHVLEL